MSQADSGRQAGRQAGGLAGLHGGVCRSAAAKPAARCDEFRECIVLLFWGWSSRTQVNLKPIIRNTIWMLQIDKRGISCVIILNYSTSHHTTLSYSAKNYISMQLNWKHVYVRNMALYWMDYAPMQKMFLNIWRAAFVNSKRFAKMWWAYSVQGCHVKDTNPMFGQ